jgi:hypothetical protein
MRACLANPLAGLKTRFSIRCDSMFPAMAIKRLATSSQRSMENLESVGLAEVFGFMEWADLTGDVALEHAAAEDQAKEREEKKGFERHEIEVEI